MNFILKGSIAAACYSAIELFDAALLCHALLHLLHHLSSRGCCPGTEEIEGGSCCFDFLVGPPRDVAVMVLLLFNGGHVIVVLEH
ncbi:hypothetical protein ACLOJK_035950 [Asimina triloba]